MKHLCQSPLFRIYNTRNKKVRNLGYGTKGIAVLYIVLIKLHKICHPEGGTTEMSLFALLKFFRLSKILRFAQNDKRAFRTIRDRSA